MCFCPQNYNSQNVKITKKSLFTTLHTCTPVKERLSFSSWEKKKNKNGDFKRVELC